MRYGPDSGDLAPYLRGTRTVFEYLVKRLFDCISAFVHLYHLYEVIEIISVEVRTPILGRLDGRGRLFAVTGIEQRPREIYLGLEKPGIDLQGVLEVLYGFIELRIGCLREERLLWQDSSLTPEDFLPELKFIRGRR